MAPTSSKNGYEVWTAINSSWDGNDTVKANTFVGELEKFSNSIFAKGAQL
jgi:hypothetical protein